jgi:acyl carrier protein
MEIEADFGVEFTDSDLSVDLFRTVGSLAAAVREKRTAAGIQ